VARAKSTARFWYTDYGDAWTQAGAARFRATGVGTAESRRLALAVIALLEGAFVLCRATRSTEPVVSAGEAAVTVVRRPFDPIGSPAGMPH